MCMKSARNRTDVSGFANTSLTLSLKTDVPIDGLHNPTTHAAAKDRLPHRGPSLPQDECTTAILSDDARAGKPKATPWSRCRVAPPQRSAYGVHQTRRTPALSSVVLTQQ